MAHAKNHDYHILPPSIDPLLGALAAFVMLFGAVAWMSGGMTIFFETVTLSGPWMFLIGFTAVLYVMFNWWSRVVEELVLVVLQTRDLPDGRLCRHGIRSPRNLSS